MQNIILFYIINEIRVRLKTSLLLWFYFSSVFIICIPNVLATIFFHQVIPFQNLPSILLFIMLLFFPINLDVFSRESQLNMLDYLAMSSARFYTIYTSRIIANAVLMVIPIILGVLSIIMSQILFVDQHIIFILLVYLLIIPPFFFSWFFIAILILSIIELKYPDSFFRVFLYYFGLFIIFGLLTLLYVLSRASFVFGVFFGQGLFVNLFLSVLVFTIICVLILWFLSLVITRRISLTVKKILMTGQERQSEKSFPKLSFYSLHEAIGSKRISSWKQIGPFLGAIPYILLFVVSPNRSDFMESFMVIFHFHFFFLILYVLFIVFPRITIEKEFNMEELILSRITVYEYFFQKIFLLLRNIFFPLIVALITITILSRSLFLVPKLASSLLLLALYAFYFVSLIIFLWRLFPAKNLLQTILLSIIGYEIFVILAAIFVFLPACYMLLYSPIVSSLMILKVMTDPKAKKIYATTIDFSHWIILISTIAFFLGSIILIKAEVRYE